MGSPSKFFKTLPYFFVFFAVLFFVSAAFLISILLQLPPIREEMTIIAGTFSSIIGFVISIWALKKILRTKFKKETCWFIIFVVIISLTVHILVNVISKLDLPTQWILTPSAIASAILSFKMAGYSKRTLIMNFKKLVRNQITLVTILILSLIPIIEYSRTFVSSYPSHVYVLPSIEFLNAENTVLVNGSISSSNFFAEIPIYRNQIFEATKMVELGIPNQGNNSIDLHFRLAGFTGNFDVLEKFEIYVTNATQKIYVINMTKDYVQCSQAKMFLQPETSLFVGVLCKGVNAFTNGATITVSLSVSHHDSELGKISILSKTIGG